MKKLFTLILMLGITVSTFGQEISQYQSDLNNTLKLEQQLERVVQKAIEIAETTGEFVIEQAPLLLQEFYKWHLITNIFYIIVAILIYLLVYFLRVKFFGSKKPFTFINGYGESTLSVRQGFRYYRTLNSEAFALNAVLNIFTLLGSLAIICSRVYNILFILVAPKLYLIEFFIK